MAGFIVGTGRYLPEGVMTNAQLGESLGVDEEWIASHAGIRARPWSEATQAASDLAVAVAQRALNAAELQPDEIDHLIAGTVSPDYQVPGIALLIQGKLGLGQIPCLDIRAAWCNPAVRLRRHFCAHRGGTGGEHVADRGGNTFSALILIALDWACDQGYLTSSQRILFSCLRCGLSMGCSVGHGGVRMLTDCRKGVARSGDRP